MLLMGNEPGELMLLVNPVGETQTRPDTLKNTPSRIQTLLSLLSGSGPEKARERGEVVRDGEGSSSSR